MRKKYAAALFALLLTPLIAAAYFSPGIPTGFVNDFASVLSADQKQSLELKLSNNNKTSGNEISVVTIQSLKGDTVENYAVELFKEWGIGKKGKDNGVLLLAAIEDRKVRIEVGYGLEGSLTDAQSYWIIQNDIVPNFRSTKYYAGLNLATNHIIAVTSGEQLPVAQDQSSNTLPVDWKLFAYLIFFIPLWLASVLGRSKSWWTGGLLGGAVAIVGGLIMGFLYFGLIAFVILVPLGLFFDFIVSKSYTKGKARGHIPWWIGGGKGGMGGGGFGGFGGGSSGGGGASGGW
ncbi:MAG: TPM domain-containing protein [Patescibacteria group bacterium]|jgi:uncharacterized protein